MYSIDVMIGIVRAFSSKEPILFHADGCLFAVSEEGFGQAVVGLSAYEKRHLRYNEEQPDEIMESESVLVECGDGRKMSRVNDSEQAYFNQIMSDPDTGAFTLGGMIESAAELRKIEDDGLIRMVGHHSSYCSHKYGYACDGTNVVTDTARVMNRQRYLELARQSEEKVYEELEHIAAQADCLETKDHWNFKGQETFKNMRGLPNVVIMTDSILLSMPQFGWIDTYGSNPLGWKRSTALNEREESPVAIKLYGFKVDEEDVHKIHVMTNQLKMEAREGMRFGARQAEVLYMLQRDLDAVSLNMGNVKAFLDRFNGYHNRICRIEIEYWRETREEWRKEKEERERKEAEAVAKKAAKNKKKVKKVTRKKTGKKNGGAKGGNNNVSEVSIV